MPVGLGTATHLLFLVLAAALQHACNGATGVEQAVEKDVGAEGHQHKSLQNTEPVNNSKTITQVTGGPPMRVALR